MSRNGKAAPLAALMLSLSFCGSVAQPVGAPTSVYAQVETPAGRETPALSADERKKLREELTKARDRQNDRVKAKEPTQVPKSKPVPRSKKP
ncbi:hypothetical protein [Bradyrhizobium sp.]|uniref:hypothetical protein n=1 Tax=Bradyrhizobium sp. TaxID=376 RepID=UPI0026273C39|nr:hypothetical protein [Bradyrhizobium sp.]